MQNFLKKVVSMAKEMHDCATEKTGNTNYFVIGIFILSVFFGGAKISNITVSTEEQQKISNEVLVLKEKVRQISDDIKDIKILLQRERNYADIRN